MTTIAHLSDLHVLEADLHGRSTTERLRLSYLTATRRKSAALRRAQLKRSLEAASLAGADHVVITGDLTEEGTPRQFELLAELLSESGLDPERVTLVPGNHDAYDDARGFERALSGPLARFAPHSARGATTVFGDTVIMAVSTAVHQTWLTSWGAMGADQYAPILGAKRRFGGRAVILAQHHPPMHRGAMHWIDGLRDTARLTRLLEGHPHVHVLHGHLHRERERALSPLGAPQIFGVAPAFDNRAPVKLYDIIDGRVVPRQSALAA
ncbi:MAG TPA: metallophosphoesterase [Polyangiaceae bacterium]|jgi:3',5'-cyclic AMP phosphodiesterase CpdA|nr:metallophosphoesterase [Polyangiaceae bacterium]